MLSISAEPLLLAGVLTVHAIVLGFIVKMLRLMKSIMAPMYLLFIGLLIATAVFVLSPADVTSIIWAVEGLAMLYIGFRYTHKLIRAEGYAIYVIAMTSLLWQAVNAFIDKYITVNPDPSAIAWHWINLVAFGILSLVAYRIIYRFKDDATPTEQKAAFVQNEIFTLWGAIALSLVMGLFLPAFMTVLAVIPMLWCFFRVSRHKLRFAQLTGFIFFAAFIVQIVIGVFDSNSTVLSEQSYISHIALLELLFFAWVLHFYFQHFELTGRGKSFATKIHQLSFYAPAFLVILSLYNIFDRHIDGYYPLIFGSIWIDFSIIGLLLYVAFQLVNKTEKLEGDIIRTRHAYLLSETLSLFISAFFLYSISLL
ncbi:MAG: hypothetical protein KAU21_18155, partial [Gammaproteobacteria bacterium]|nr:hypothetical protein [Gammaproteobacteria bacterium]